MEEKNTILSGKPIRTKHEKMEIFHKKNSKIFKVDSINFDKKKVKVTCENKIFYYSKKFKFDEIIFLKSTDYKDSFGNEIYENSLIRDFNSDEIGVVKFGLYKENDNDIDEHFGFYIEWFSPEKQIKKCFNHWILKGIQVVDFQYDLTSHVGFLLNEMNNKIEESKESKE